MSKTPQHVDGDKAVVQGRLSTAKAVISLMEKALANGSATARIEKEDAGIVERVMNTLRPDALLLKMRLDGAPHTGFTLHCAWPEALHKGEPLSACE